MASDSAQGEGPCPFGCTTQEEHDAHQPAQPVAVPAVATEAMLIAARDWSTKKYGIPIGNEAAQGCWAAMLAASPQPGHAGALTEVQIDEMWSAEIERSKDMSLKRQWLRFARAIERAHGIAPKAAQEKT